MEISNKLLQSLIYTFKVIISVRFFDPLFYLAITEGENENKNL